MFDKLINVLIFIKLLLIVINITGQAVSAPLPSDQLCSVRLVPNKLTANRFEESLIKIKCEATLHSALVGQSFEFMNPVFDLSFGGAPRTGLFIVRGNTECDDKYKCWSEYQIPANSIGHLIQHTGSVDYVCQVADQLKNSTDKVSARCQNTGHMTFSNVLKYGDLCNKYTTGEECDGRTMTCGTPETENEAESSYQCVCKNGFTSVPISYKSTICVEEVPLGSICNYTKQCSAIDANSVCDANQFGVKVCQCTKESEEFTEFRTDYTKRCRPKSSTTTTTEKTDTDHDSKDVTTHSVGHNHSQALNKNENLVDNGFKTSPKDKSGSLGIILFFVAIFLAIIIVIIIIRVRNKSDKRTVNKRRTIQMQTDGEQKQPILASDGKTGVDEVDANNKTNDSQKVQTNV